MVSERRKGEQGCSAPNWRLGSPKNNWRNFDDKVAHRSGGEAGDPCLLMW